MMLQIDDFLPVSYSDAYERRKRRGRLNCVDECVLDASCLGFDETRVSIYAKHARKNERNDERKLSSAVLMRPRWKLRR